MARTHTGFMLAPIALLALICTIIYSSGGNWGFRAFLNLEALVFVVLGTSLLVWATYPVRSWRTAEATLYASQCATVMGVLGTLLGMIMLLSNVVDISEMPRRTALSLSAMFYGLFLSKAILLPMSHRIRGSGSDE
jgi:flagellar motor component MotA